MRDIRTGLRAALRSVSRHRATAAAVIVTVGLGIGASTAMLSVVRGVLAHSIPYAREHELVQVTSTLAQQGITQGLVAFPRFQAYDAQSRSFAGLVAYVKQDVTLTDGPTPVSVPAARISEGFLALIGVAPLLGRDFTEEEQVRGGARAAMISERVWRTRYAGAAEVTSRTITVNGEAMPIVGVAPARLAPPLEDADILLPRVYEPDILPPEQVERGSGYLRVMGRLLPGVTAAGALQDLQRVVADYRVRFGTLRDASMDVAVVPLATYVFGDVRDSLVFLWIAAFLVFLIACANAGNLLLARYLGRRTELDIRTAMGATRSHITVQLVSECALLSAGGVVVGLLAAVATLRLLEPLAAQVLGTTEPFAFDTVVFAGAAAFGGLAIMITGAIPALHATAEHRNAVISSGSRNATAGRGAARWRRVFVVAQVAVSFALLAGAVQQGVGLLALQRLDRGFDGAGLVSFRVAPSAAKYPTPESRLDLYRRVEERVAAVPGVTAVGASQAMVVGDDQVIAFSSEADQARRREEWPQAQFRIVSPGYFGAIGMTLLRGRGFNAFDSKDGAPVVIVNETVARRQLGGTDAIGARIFLGSFPGSREVVGVVTDVRQRWLEPEPLPEVYMPESQLPVRLPPMHFFVRSAVAPVALFEAIRAEVAAVDPAQPITRAASFAAAADEGLAIPRMRAYLVVGFALLGVVLTTVGLWSVMAQFVAERTRELGIRLALGEPPSTVRAHVIRSVLAVTGTGLAIGLVVALTMSRVTEHTFVGISTPGAMVLAAVGAFILTMGCLIGFALARRATRVEPASVLAG